jgi:hypothetical protein
MAKEYTKDELAKWFETKALSLKGTSARNVLFDADTRHTEANKTFVGSMYFFRYDPKHKLTLSLYDKYPLAIVVEKYSDGFMGLNMHYMSKGQRGGAVRMFTDFYQKQKLQKAPTTGRGLSNWELLTNTSSRIEGFARASVHRYLFNHVRSQFIRIEPNEYDKAVQLPIDEWVIKR